MKRMARLMVAGLALAGSQMLGSAAAQAVPIFYAKCPVNVNVDSDTRGVVRVNGRIATVRRVNAQYFEARLGRVIYSISGRPGEVSVSYTGPGRANGICQVQEPPRPPARPVRPAARAPSIDAQACLRAVTQQSNNPDVVLLSEEYSEANTLVMVGVGPNKAPWKCLSKRGRVAEVMSILS